MATTWIVVADAARARILTADGDLAAFDTLDVLVHPESRLHDTDLQSDSAGSDRTAESGKRHEAEHAAFAREVARYVQAGRTRGDWEHLVLVAAPRFLGHLRGELGPNESRAVLASVAKDHSRLSDHELARVLARDLEGTHLPG